MPTKNTTSKSTAKFAHDPASSDVLRAYEQLGRIDILEGGLAGPSFVDVSVLASFTDSVITVSELGTTKRDLLNRGVNLLQRSSARLIGVVLRENQPSKKKSRRKAAA